MASLIELLLSLVTLWTARWLWVLLSTRRILHNIPGPPSPSFLTVLPRNMEASSDSTACSGYDTLGSTYYFLSLGPQEKQLYVFDPKSLYQILVKDIFEEADSNLYGSLVLFGEGILVTSGEQHKKQRKMLNPAFSAAHLRQMVLTGTSNEVPIFFDVGKRVSHSIVPSNPQSNLAFRMVPKRSISWYIPLGSSTRPLNHPALDDADRAGTHRPGHSFDSLDTDEIPPYITSVKQLQVTVHKMALGMKYILPWVTKLGTPNFRRLIVNIFPWQTLHEGRDIADTLYATAVLVQGGVAVSFHYGASSTLIFAATDSELPLPTIHLQRLTLTFQRPRPLFLAPCIFWPNIQTHKRNFDERYSPLSNHQLISRTTNSTQWSIWTQSAEKPSACTLRYLSFEECEHNTMRQARTQKDVALTTSTPITTLDGSTVTEIPVPVRTEVIVSILASKSQPSYLGIRRTRMEARTLVIAVAEKRHRGASSGDLLPLWIQVFATGDDDEHIAWQMSALAVPSVDGKEQLPLKVELAK
ncbi:hypothetical protein B0H14DRAFT_2578354 [Mycena olivaceomarginata]|nr:hypothetical protein B0H14DRAFT_2578354 [Mycena olivaceomarginata]